MTTALSAWLVVVAAGWLLAFAEVRRRRADDTWRLRPEDRACDPAERVAVLVPARDEARGIAAALAAILAQDHPRLEIRVLDDGSTDGTGEILAGFHDPRLTVLDGGASPPPAGWLGKAWACARLAADVDADWLLFVDADVVLAPEAVSRAVARARERDLSLLSGVGTQITASVGEEVVQASVIGLILAGNPMDRVNDPDNTRPLANGQFLLFSRAAYDAVGGHGAVRGDVLDDVGLAIAVRAAGSRTETSMMRRLFSVRMYTSGRDAWRGWRKNLFPGMARRWGLLAFVVGFQLAAILLPYACFAAWVVGGAPLHVGAPATAAVVAIQALRWHVDGVFGRRRLLGQVTHAIGALVLVALAVDSAVCTTLGWATWKGRHLPRAGRGASGSGLG